MKSILDITYKAQTISNSILIGSDGLDTSMGNVQMTDYAMLDGSIHTRSRLDKREIRLRYAPINDIESARQELLTIYEPKSSGTLLISTPKKTYTTTGYVMSIDYDLWTQREIVEITIVCPDPWLYSTESKTITPTTTQWIVQNDGASVGFTVALKPSGYIYTLNTSVYFRWDATDIVDATDILMLDTRDGHRDLYLAESPSESLMDYITEWNWITVPHGRNVIRSNAVGGNLSFTERWSGI